MLEQTRHVGIVCTRKDEVRKTRCAAGATNFLENGLYLLILLETLRRDLLFARKAHLNLVVHHKYIVRAYLIDLADDDLTNTLGILFVDVILLNVANTLVEILNSLCDKAPTKGVRDVLERDLFDVFIADHRSFARLLGVLFC